MNELTPPPLIQALRIRRAKANSDVQGFEVKLPDGSGHLIGNGGEPMFTLRVVNERGWRALSKFDELATAEAYMAGEIDFEGPLAPALKHRALLADRRPISYLFQTYLAPFFFGQTRQDRKWVSEHYDIDPQFFLLWLDGELRAYSHGFFESDDETLETGIARKFQFALDACGIRPGQRVLDIGGGWGSFAKFAGQRGVQVTSLTISEESRKAIEAVIAQHALPCKVLKEHFLEYRTGERFDAIVNLGVTEHLPDYRRTVCQYERLLKPGRRVYLDAYSGDRHGMPSFIRKWVFPGNTSPLCLRKYLGALALTKFEVVLVKNDRHNYYLTCKKWAEKLAAHKAEVCSRWGGHLYRRFNLYLWAAANSFESGTLSAHHLILQLPGAESPRLAGLEVLP